MTVVYLTSGSSWTVPADCTLLDWVDCIGAGANGGLSGLSVVGGGGGAFARKFVVAVTPGASIATQVGAGLDTVFGGTSLASCTCGAAKGSGTSGGLASASVGDVKYNGGNGNGSFGGGGGAAGTTGDGQSSGGYAGGAGDAGFGGAGGAVNADGGAGTEYDASHGSGGGAGGRNTSGNGRAGGAYGGGGGGRISGSDGPGYQGLIVISYTPSTGGAARSIGFIIG